MTQLTTEIPITSIFLDEDIYHRKGIDHRRVGMFTENIRDGFTFDPIEVEPAPGKPGWYRLLDGAHRWNVYKSTGKEMVKVLGQKFQNISESSWYPPGQDCNALGDRPENDT